MTKFPPLYWWPIYPDSSSWS